jgi:NAD(P)-dependent dehydrogenase (short-subunit alcohol dehydrogenase family)
MTEDKWTTAQIPDLSGRTVVVTGANSGVGFAATRAFARADAQVVMGCRSDERGADARDEIEADVDDASLSVLECDLGDLASIRAFAERFRDQFGDLHVLCNNAGVMAIPYRETAEGFERQFGVNHLGHFALTGYLLGPLTSTDEETRVITQSSGLHERGEMDLDGGALPGESEYDPWDAYARSKLANVLFAYELDRRFDASGTSATSIACHPGWAATNLQRRGPEMNGSRLGVWVRRVANHVFAQSVKQGALPMLYAATADDVRGGEYVGPSGLMNMRGSPERQRSSDRSYDRTLAARLWEASEELTGVTYDLDRPARA